MRHEAFDMTAAQFSALILDVIFLGIVGYGVYLLRENAIVQRSQQRDINNALIDAVSRAQKNNELSANAAQKLAEVVYALHTEMSISPPTLPLAAPHVSPVPSGKVVTSVVETETSKGEHANEAKLTTTITTVVEKPTLREGLKQLLEDYPEDMEGSD